MKQTNTLALYVLIAATSPTVACVASSAAVDGAENSAAEPVEVDNALTSNALTSNALTSNALTSNALTSNALTAEALTSNALTSSALLDPEARKLLKYIVSCALPEGKRLDVRIGGATYRFRGQIGLTPGWGHEGGSCGASCRSWVSGCVLSRLNYLGERVSISIRGSRGQLTSDEAERLAYPHREAAYYGDIFASEPIYHACLPPGATEIPRVCGPSLDGCVLDVVGTCDRACDKPRCDGSYPHCRDHVRDELGRFPVGTRSYTGTVTVFLR